MAQPHHLHRRCLHSIWGEEGQKSLQYCYRVHSHGRSPHYHKAHVQTSGCPRLKTSPSRSISITLWLSAVLMRLETSSLQSRCVSWPFLCLLSKEWNCIPPPPILSPLSLEYVAQGTLAFTVSGICCCYSTRFNFLF